MSYRSSSRLRITFLGFEYATFVFALLWVSSTPAVAEPPSPDLPYDPTDRYQEETMLGWKLIISDRLIDDHPDLCQEALGVLRHQLFSITRVVPEPALAKLKQIPIWIEYADPHHPCACYHGDVKWLIHADRNPDKANCVEIANAARFISWTNQQPWMMLHELAHGYHDEFLDEGYENADVKETYLHAMEEGNYEEVLRYNGRTVRHYGANNQMEYFSEATEAYFGTNDYFPFVRSELQQHDPECVEMLERVWMLDQ